LERLQQIDYWLFRQGNTRLASPWADGFFLWITAPPYRVVVFLLLWSALFFLGGRRGRIAALTLIVVVAAADEFGVHLKSWIGRLRPCFVFSDVRLLIPGQSHSGSCPSNHATNAFAVARLLWNVGPVWRWAGLCAAVLVAYSRIYVGVHYPSDALAGAVLGCFFGYIGIRFRDAIFRTGPRCRL
jgi:undecaprenyl-diphosphatase